MGAAPTMNRSAQGGARSSLHYEGEGVLIHPPHQGVCGRHGREEQRVTSGGLAGSPGGTGGLVRRHRCRGVVVARGAPSWHSLWRATLPSPLVLPSRPPLPPSWPS